MKRWTKKRWTSKGSTWTGGALIGAGLMYLLDPERGRRRRGMIRDKTLHALGAGQDAIATTSRDLRNRARGLAAEARKRFSAQEAPDEVLAERVRARIGRVVSHPRSIEVTVRGGTVTLAGPVLAHEIDDLLSSVSAVRGVRSVESRLETHKQAGDVPGLQGGVGRPSHRFPALPVARP
jgi:osmotically-inducible protein OsmY